jgi:hypothetical protein
MSNEIGLQELIYQVKQELLATNRAAQARDPYPTFVIDKIELEIQVKITRDKTGAAKLTVLGIGEIGGDQSTSHERGHTVRVSLSSLLSVEDIAEQILKDPHTSEQITREAARAFVKGVEGLGEKPN